MEADRYFLHLVDPDLHLVDPDGGNDRVLGEGTDPRWFPDRRRLASTAPASGSWQVIIVDVGTGDALQLTP